MSPQPSPFVTWTQALIARHQADLQFAEVRRGLQALSAQYVQRKLAGPRPPLSGRGKRAAFALYYGPMHYAVVVHAAQAHGLAVPAEIDDLGCGTGMGAAAWASLAPPQQDPQQGPVLTGVDLSAWALAEARWNWAQLGLRGRVVRGDMTRQAFAPAARPGARGVICAFSLNELDDGPRATLLAQLLARAAAGHSVLVVEPIARAVSPWWPAFVQAAAAHGGQALEHKFASPLPEALRRYAQAAGLDHRLLSGRSVALAPLGQGR